MSKVDNKHLITSFNVDDFMMEYGGGFGRYQLCVVIIMTLIRNFGSLPVYFFALDTEPMVMLCLNDAKIS